ncbi:MAG: hypothetical protein SCALA702_30930 [Melioribacteraceae bacterium]|nr:MAG: hypothetical protein SCALA702_30930 [Melioribacteraceae bacterium]
MKNYKIAGYSGVVLLLIFLFTPIASINDSAATILPVYDNVTIASGFWNWVDISAFAMTLAFIVPLSLYFVAKGKSLGVLITTTIAMISSLFILMAVWIADLNAVTDSGLNFHFSYGWLVLLLSLTSLYFSGSKLRQFG